MQVLEAASQTFTLLSDELWRREEEKDASFIKPTQFHQQKQLVVDGQTGGQRDGQMEIQPGDKVAVVRGEGHVEDPGAVSAQRSCQVGVLPAAQNTTLTSAAHCKQVDQSQHPTAASLGGLVTTAFKSI